MPSILRRGFFRLSSDSIVMRLQLLGDGIHDWHYLLSTLGILQYTPIVAGVIYTMGFITICIGTALSLYYAWTEPESVAEVKFI